MLEQMYVHLPKRQFYSKRLKLVLKSLFVTAELNYSVGEWISL